MKELASLVVLGVATAAVLFMAERLPDERAPQAALLAIGFLLLASWLLGRLFEQVRLPKITGFLVLGFVVGPAALGVVTRDQLDTQLRFVNDLAVWLIALTAGGELRLDWLRDKARRIFTLIAVDVVVMMTVAIGATFLAWHLGLIPFLPPGEDSSTVLFVCLLLGTIMITNSPMVVIAMISEYRASGPLSQTTLALTVCKDMTLIVLFACVMALGRGLLVDGSDVSGAFLLAVGAQIFGSFAIGALAGVAMAYYVGRVGAHLPAFVVGCGLALALLSQQHFDVGGTEVHFELLLIALAAGLVMENVWPERCGPLFRAIEETSLPVYCLFFAVQGAKVDPQTFRELWYLALGLYLLRLGSVYAGVRAGARVAGIRGPWVGKLFLGLIPQAGVSFVLVSVIEAGFPAAEFPWGPKLASVLIGMIVLNELTGPIAFRYGLFSSGEARAAGGGDGGPGGPAGGAPTKPGSGSPERPAAADPASGDPPGSDPGGAPAAGPAPRPS